MNGLKQACLYAFAPCRLGFCGRKFNQSYQTLYNYIIGREKSANKVKNVLKSFEAAFPYLKLIASASNIKNPFSEKVVEALWLGNNFLDNINFAQFKNMVMHNFLKPGLLSEQEARNRLIKLKNKKIYPHHSFHVLKFGSITGIEFKPRMYDLCRVSWGKVIKICQEKTDIYQGSFKIIVQYQPIKMENSKFYLGKEVRKEIYWKKEFVEDLRVGDTITFHWDLVCQKINKKQEINLRKYTEINIR